MFKRFVLIAFVVFAGGSLGAQAPAPAVIRTPLLTQDLPTGGQAATLVSVVLPVGSREGLHVHSGTLIAYVAEGTLTFDQEGKPTATYKPGDSFTVEAGKVHEGINQGTAQVKLIATFVGPKDQPLTTPVTK
jgi:quercetin dioxygenase-like cupin family protein